MPFATPALVNARVRKDNRDRMEVLLPSISHGKGIYIISGNNLAEVIPLTVHDRMLHEAILKKESMSPSEIHDAALKLAISGVAGAAARKAAKAEVERAEEVRLVTLFILLRRALQQFSTYLASGFEIDVKRLGTGEGREIAGVLLRDAAQQLGITAQNIVDRLEEWSAILSPAGPPEDKMPGRLRKTTSDIQWFSENLTEWSLSEQVEAAKMATYCAEAARQTAECALDKEGEIYKIGKDMSKGLANWDKTRADLRDSVNRYSWVTDGWDNIISVWRAALERSRWEQRDSLAYVARLVPLLPDEAVGEVVRQIFRKFNEEQKRWVGAYQDWLSGDTDTDVMRRLDSGVR